MDSFFRFMMRRRILVPGTILMGLLTGWVFVPESPDKWVRVGLASLFAGAMWFLPRIPPEDMHIKP